MADIKHSAINDVVTAYSISSGINFKTKLILLLKIEKHSDGE